MFNITKQGSSLLITSNDNSQFPWKDGQMSLPMNSVVYVIDESDYIAFRSASNNDILFTANIDEIQINGTQATRDNIIELFDLVANGSNSGTASAGVNSINGFQGDLNIKSINGESLIGSGDITIEGGSGSAGVEYISTSSEPNEYNTFIGGVKLTTGFTDLDDDGVSETYDVAIGGTLQDGTEAGSVWFGLRSSDGSITLEDGGGRVNLTVNPDILGGGSSTEYTAGDGISIADNTISNTGVTAINIGENEDANFQKTSVVKLYTNFYDGSYDVAIGGTSFYGLKPIDDTITLENAGGTANGNFRCGIKVNKESLGIPTIWTGTQSEYDALGTYDDNTIYNIIEG